MITGEIDSKKLKLSIIRLLRSDNVQDTSRLNNVNQRLKIMAGQRSLTVVTTFVTR